MVPLIDFHYLFFDSLLLVFHSVKTVCCHRTRASGKLQELDLRFFKLEAKCTTNALRKCPVLSFSLKS